MVATIKLNQQQIKEFTDLKALQEAVRVQGEKEETDSRARCSKAAKSHDPPQYHKPLHFDFTPLLKSSQRSPGLVHVHLLFSFDGPCCNRVSCFTKRRDLK